MTVTTGHLRILVAAAVIVSVATGGGLYASGSLPSFDAGVNPPNATVGQSITLNGVTITLEGVQYSSSKTTVTFAVTDDEGVVGERLYPVLDISTAGGIAPRKPLFSIGAIGGYEPHQAKETVELGAVTDPSKQITVRVNRVYLQSFDASTPRGKDVKGPWTFQFVPGPSAIDPVDVEIPIGAQRTAEGVTVKVDSVHLSSSDVRVQYNLEADRAYLGRAHWVARMILPDGAWLGGVPSQDNQDKIEGDLEARFPPLPSGVRNFTIAFGPYLADVPGPFKFVIPLSGIPADTPANVAMRQDFTIAQERIQLDSLNLRPDGFDLVFQNVNPGKRTVIPNLAANRKLEDDLGNTYSIVAVQEIAPDSPAGAPESGTAIVKVAEQLDSMAHTLTLEVDSLARLAYGPWDVEVTVP